MQDTYDLDLHVPDFVDEERHGYGAYVTAIVHYKLVDVVRHDTPKGQDMGQEIVITGYDEEQIFVMDQDGGELYDQECEVLKFIKEDELKELIQKSL